MTTEVAVINRLGVALATDSAVTITGGGKSKVFDSGNKLFELNCDDPVGIMINGNMDLLGVPWELIIKDFRSSPSSPPSSIRGHLQNFLDFAAQHKAYNNDAEKRHIDAYVRDELERIKGVVSRRILHGEETVTDAKDVAVLVLGETEKRLAFLQTKPRAISLRGVTEKDFLNKYGGLLNSIMDEVFPPVPIGAAEKRRLRKMISTGILSEAQSDFSTGVVVAGYAPGDMFPSLAIVEVDGAVCGKLKYVHGEHVVIDRARNPGRVISFAQTDVADRLLSGADAQFVHMSAEYIAASLESSKDAIIDTLKLSGQSARNAKAIFEAMASAAADEYRNRFATTAREGFQRHFNEMVALMPKQEILELAEALVSITAIERKASHEQETVGGPVDLAFITRHEGFVWIKRKLYFPANLNPRYFWRKFNVGSLSGDPP
jgi:hypothetical protein